MDVASAPRGANSCASAVSAGPCAAAPIDHRITTKAKASGVPCKSTSLAPRVQNSGNDKTNDVSCKKSPCNAKGMVMSDKELNSALRQMVFLGFN